MGIPLLTEAELQSATVDPATGELYFLRASGEKIVAGVVSGATDAQTAGFVADPESLTNAQLSTTYARQLGQVIQFDSLPQITDGVFQYNAVAFSQDSIIAYKNWLYVVFIARQRRMMVGKRPLAGGRWSVFDLGTIAGAPLSTVNDPDGHNNWVVAVDKAGRLHVTGDHHDYHLQYAWSTGVANSDGEVDITSWASNAGPNYMTGTGENSVTYPQFVRAGDDTLLFLHRDGESGNGRYLLKRHNHLTNTWADVAVLLDGLTSGDSPYIDSVQVAPDGTMHLFGVWRATGAADTNRDVFYMKSTDNGVTWKTVAGSSLTLPVTYATSPTVLPTASSNSGLINQCGSSVDTAGRPHKSMWLDDADNNTQLYHLWYDGAAWHNDKVTDFKDGAYNDTGSGLPRSISSRPNCVSTPDGRTYITYRYLNRRGSIRMIDVTPPVVGLPNLGDFPVLGIDYHDAEPVWSSWSRRDGLLLMLINDTAQGIGAGDTFWSSQSRWWQTMGHVIAIRHDYLPQIASGMTTLPHVQTVASGSMGAAAAITSTVQDTVTGAPRVVVPAGFGDRLLVARVRGFATGAGTVMLAALPASKVGTITSIPVTGAAFESPWVPLDMSRGDWSTGGVVEARALVASGTMTVTALSIEVGIVNGGDGTPARGALLNDPTTAGAAPVGTVLASYDATTITGLTDGAAVTTLADLSGNGNTVVQATTTAQPAYDIDGINGFPSLVFAGGDSLVAPAFAIGSEFTLFLVAKWDGTGPNPQAIASQDEGAQVRVWQAQAAGASSVNGTGFTSAGTATTDGAAGTTTNPFVLEILSTTGAVETFINGVSDGSTARGSAGSTKAAKLVIGGRIASGVVNAADSFHGWVGALVIIAGALTAPQRLAKRQELAAKFGITL